MWFGFALLLFFALYPLTLYKLALGHNQDGSRPFHFMLLAAPAIVGAAWHITVSTTGEVFVVLYYGALLLAPIMAYGIWPMRCAALHAEFCLYLTSGATDCS